MRWVDLGALLDGRSYCPDLELPVGATVPGGTTIDQRAKNMIKSRNRRARLKALGRCIDCARVQALAGRLRCRGCLDKLYRRDKPRPVTRGGDS